MYILRKGLHMVIHPYVYVGTCIPPENIMVVTLKPFLCTYVIYAGVTYTPHVTRVCEYYRI